MRSGKYKGDGCMKEYKNVKLINHPMVQHKLTILRDVNTGVKEFREIVEEL